MKEIKKARIEQQDKPFNVYIDAPYLYLLLSKLTYIDKDLKEEHSSNAKSLQHSKDQIDKLPSDDYRDTPQPQKYDINQIWTSLLNQLTEALKKKHNHKTL